MMSTTVMILLVLLIVYIPLWYIVWKHPSALRHGFEKYGPAIKINSRFGLRFIERFSRYHRFWHYFGIFSQIVSFALMVMMIYIMAVSVMRLPTLFASGNSIGIEYALALPGLNPMLPLWYGLFALIVAMVCHEMAHGLQSKSNGISVEHTGLLYAVVPLGAFVEPNQAEVEKASRRAKMDLYTAGISTNFIIALISFILFSPVMLGSISSEYGDSCAVYMETDEVDVHGDIPVGSIVTMIEGSPVIYDKGYYSSSEWTYSWTPGTSVTVTYDTESSKNNTTSAYWGAYVGGTVAGSPAESLTVNSGSPITTLEKVLLNSLEYQGETYYFMSAAGFSSFMTTTVPGEVMGVNWTKTDGTSGNVSLTLGDNSGIGYIGIYTTTSGMNLITPNQLLEVAANPLAGATGPAGYATSMLGYIANPVNGFSPVPESVEWWFGDLGSGFWIVCKALFWLFWLNIMLGVTNAIPAVPFDGGFVFHGWVDAALEKRGVTDPRAREERANIITHNVSSFMLFLYMILIIAILV